MALSYNSAAPMQNRIFSCLGCTRFFTRECRENFACSVASWQYKFWQHGEHGDVANLDDFLKVSCTTYLKITFLFPTNILLCGWKNNQTGCASFSMHQLTQTCYLQTHSQRNGSLQLPSPSLTHPTPSSSIAKSQSLVAAR